MSLDAIGIVSADLSKTVAFYSILGIELKECGSSDHLVAQTESGLRLMADSFELMKKLNPNWTKPIGSSAIALAFKKESTKSVDETFQIIKDKGYEVITEPWNAFWGQRYASVKDPDGNQIDIFADIDQ